MVKIKFVLMPSKIFKQEVLIVLMSDFDKIPIQLNFNKLQNICSRNFLLLSQFLYY